ncbi:biotin-protein ligase domain protein [Metarhizium robertsii]|uniref:Biotin-protein ligase domain protein n=1 Tax=Metarhizium robertsii TaxID=568076 RepID=A0A0A1UPI7_9HYPO|nr:biotin-protein ligase domain protein [Metarhizium robertsii]
MPRPRALVYRGPASSHGLPEAVARLLESSPRRFEVQYAGPSEAVQVSHETLSESISIFQLVTPPHLDDAWAETRAFAPAIRRFVSRGGRYVGFCLGAYLAGHTPGFGLLPRGADTDAENDQDGAQVTTDADAIVQVDWRFATGPQAGRTAAGRWLYFQEGAVIRGLRESETAIVLGRYSQGGRVAASLTKYGEGWVGLVGPHPEATLEWFAVENLDCPHGEQFDIGHDLIEATMAGGRVR